VVGLIILAVLGVLFIVLLWVKVGQPENQGASLGHNSPWPDSVFVPPPGVRPPLGSPESLESHAGSDWVDAKLRQERRRHRHGGG
jgi:hypothetical protein